MKKIVLSILLFIYPVFVFAEDYKNLIGKNFIDFYGKDEKGKIVKLSDIAGKGKPVVVVYWAIGDVDTYTVLPEINKIGKKYKDKIILIAPLLSVSNEKEVKEAKKFLPFDFPVWLAGSDSIRAYSIEKVDVPYIVFIDKEGNIKNIIKTARNIKEIEENIKSLLD